MTELRTRTFRVKDFRLRDTVEFWLEEKDGEIIMKARAEGTAWRVLEISEDGFVILPQQKESNGERVEKFFMESLGLQVDDAGFLKVKKMKPYGGLYEG